MLKPGGACFSLSQAAIAVAGDKAVCSWVRRRPPNSSTSFVTTVSAFLLLVAPISRRRAFRSIHTSVAERFGKARGSSACTMSSFSSRLALPFGRRPVSASIFSRRAFSWSFTTLPGTALVSLHSFRISCPPTLSSSTPCCSPRGSIQPVLSACDGPHSVKRPLSRRWAMVSCVGGSHWSML